MAIEITFADNVPLKDGGKQFIILLEFQMSSRAAQSCKALLNKRNYGQTCHGMA